MMLLQLFLEFARTGLFAVGGGLATLPFLYSLSDKTNWFSHEQLTDMLAVSESTPGPIGVNTATYVGFATAGLLGAVTATIGLVLPSVIVILIVARVLDKFRESVLVKSVFYGLRPCSTGLIAASGLSVVELTLLNMDALKSCQFLNALRLPYLIIAVILFFAMKKFPKHPAFYIALSAVIGIVFKL